MGWAAGGVEPADGRGEEQHAAHQMTPESGCWTTTVPAGKEVAHQAHVSGKGNCTQMAEFPIASPACVRSLVRVLLSSATSTGELSGQ